MFYLRDPNGGAGSVGSSGYALDPSTDIGVDHYWKDVSGFLRDGLQMQLYSGSTAATVNINGFADKRTQPGSCELHGTAVLAP
jgi:hypothetical protein